MKTVLQQNLRRWCLFITLLGATLGAGAQPNPTPPPTTPPPPVGSGALTCEKRPLLCAALHKANLALIDAARINGSTVGVCTLGPENAACGAPPPQTYLKGGPEGNPKQVERGRWLLDWYLTNLNCKALCTGRPGAPACEQRCNAGEDPGPPLPQKPPGRVPAVKP